MVVLCTMQVKGDITFNGYGFDECVVGRTAAYVDQVRNLSCRSLQMLGAPSMAAEI